MLLVPVPNSRIFTPASTIPPFMSSVLETVTLLARVMLPVDFAISRTLKVSPMGLLMD